MNVKVNIPYPEIRVEKENCYYADLLRQDYAGSEGEITAVMLYSFQHFDKFKTNPEISKILEEIAVVEMYHMELLAKRKAAIALGIDHSTLVKKCQRYGI